MIALNSLCVVGLVVCVVFLAAIGLHWSVKRYLIPAIERRQWLREYRRQRAREYAAMMAVFAPTPEEMFFNHIQRDHGSIYGLKRAPNETPDQYTERILFTASEEDGLRYHEQIETPPTPVRR